MHLLTSKQFQSIPIRTSVIYKNHILIQLYNKNIAYQYLYRKANDDSSLGELFNFYNKGGE
nr:MAG TPA: hypothetical protein [Caudoviricetes sp.]